MLSKITVAAVASTVLSLASEASATVYSIDVQLAEFSFVSYDCTELICVEKPFQPSEGLALSVQNNFARFRIDTSAPGFRTDPSGRFIISLIPDYRAEEPYFADFLRVPGEPTCFSGFAGLFVQQYAVAVQSFCPVAGGFIFLTFAPDGDLIGLRVELLDGPPDYSFQGWIDPATGQRIASALYETWSDDPDFHQPLLGRAQGTWSVTLSASPPPSPIPLPASALLLGAGLAGLAGLRRRRVGRNAAPA